MYVYSSKFTLFMHYIKLDHSLRWSAISPRGGMESADGSLPVKLFIANYLIWLRLDEA